MSSLAWDAYIENESEFTVLPAGEYEFTVTKFEKTWYDGSSKIEPCNCAALELTISSPGVGKSVMKERLFLVDKVEWKLCEFFRCIGQKVHGQGVTMNWNTVLGSKGRAMVEVNTYQGNDGNTYTNNRVTRYLDPEVELGGEEEGPW